MDTVYDNYHYSGSTFRDERECDVFLVQDMLKKYLHLTAYVISIKYNEIVNEKTGLTKKDLINQSQNLPFYYHDSMMDTIYSLQKQSQPAATAAADVIDMNTSSIHLMNLDTIYGTSNSSDSRGWRIVIVILIITIIKIIMVRMVILFLMVTIVVKVVNIVNVFLMDIVIVLKKVHILIKEIQMN